MPDPTQSPIALPADVVKAWLELAGLSAPQPCRKHAATPSLACVDCRHFYGHDESSFRRRVVEAERKLHEIVNTTRALRLGWRFVDDEPVRKIEGELAEVKKNVAALRELFNHDLERPSLNAPDVVDARNRLARKVRDLLKAAQQTKEPRRMKGGRRGRPQGPTGINGTDAGERCFVLLYAAARRSGGNPGIARMGRLLKLLRPYLPQHVHFPASKRRIERLMLQRRERDAASRPPQNRKRMRI